MNNRKEFKRINKRNKKFAKQMEEVETLKRNAESESKSESEFEPK